MNHATNEFAPAPVRWFLARLMTHTELDAEEQRAILRLSGQAAEVSAGAVIARPNATLAHSHLVARGVLAQFDEARDGRRNATKLTIPGDMCGIQSIEHPTISWGLSALTSCTVIHVAHDDLKKLIDRFPPIRRAFWREMAIDASVQAKWTANASLKHSGARAAHILCELSWRMELAGLGDRSTFTLKTSQTRLSEVLGLTVVHTNRVLRELREDGLIATDARTIQVTNWKGLSDLANFEPAYLH